jgi:hypothetical protein
VRTTDYTTYAKRTTVRGCDLELGIGDFTGMKSCNELRPLYYGDVRVVLMCMSMSNCDSLENLEENVSARNREVRVSR